MSTTRRDFMAAGSFTVIAFAGMGLPAFALDTGEARSLIDKAVADLNAIINSGKSQEAMFADFEKLFAKYADVKVIARSALGPSARTATEKQMTEFTKAYQRYVSRKYGRRFREFIGGKIEVVDAKPIKSYVEIQSTATLKGQAPFDLRWHVSDKSGKNLFFNLVIEGINMLASERTEIGAMLDARRGNIDLLIEDLYKS